MISSRVTHCQQPGSSIGTQPRAKLFREEPEAVAACSSLFVSHAT